MNCLKCGEEMKDYGWDIWKCPCCGLGLDRNNGDDVCGLNYALFNYGDWISVPEGCLLVMGEVNEG